MPDKKRFDKRKDVQKRIALQHITELAEEAKKCFSSNPMLSHKYAEKIQKTQMRMRVKIPREIKRRICKNCHKFLVPGANCRVRTNKGKIVFKCLECNAVMKVVFKK